MATLFYSHVNYSVTKIGLLHGKVGGTFYSHVNYSVTKILGKYGVWLEEFYSHVNYSVTKISPGMKAEKGSFTVT